MKYLFSAFYSLLILSLTGMSNLAYAVSCSEMVDTVSGTTYSQALTQFLYINGKTYAIAKSAFSGFTVLPDGYFAFEPGITREYLLDGVDILSLRKKLASGMYGAARPLSVKDAATNDFIVKNYGTKINVAGSSGTLIDAWKDYNAPDYTDISGAALGKVGNCGL